MLKKRGLLVSTMDGQGSSSSSSALYTLRVSSGGQLTICILLHFLFLLLSVFLFLLTSQWHLWAARMPHVRRNSSR